MISERKLFWFFLLASIGLLLVMNLVSLPRITAGTDGLLPYDMRLIGYSYTEASRFLEMISPDGMDTYLNLLQPLDTAFPIAYCGLLFSVIWQLSKQSHAVLRVALLTIPVCVLLVDYTENYYIRQILVGGAESLSERLVTTASLLTITKYSGIGLSILAIIGLGIKRLRSKN